jgi:hypothetical protein
MDAVDFLAAVEAYGADNILAIHFNNAARHLFTKNKRFSLANDYKADLKGLEFEMEDVRGTKATVFKPVATVETIIVAQNESDWDRIATRTIGG